MAPKVLWCCLAVVRWTPVVFIVSVIVWSYYAYVLQMCLFTIDNIAEKVIYLLLFHPIFLIFMWTYWRTIFTNPGVVPKEFYLSRSDLERYTSAEDADARNDVLVRLARNLPVQCRTSSGYVRYCEKCAVIKPDRAHHCSVCGACVLKMDHHCPWVNNCVNFSNYKYFILFLGWGLVYCLFVAATSAQYFVRFWSDLEKDMSNLHIVFLFFAGVMFAISLVSLFGYHLYLVSVNRSTLESFRAPVFRGGPDKDGFSLGKLGNVQEVFGDDKRHWCIPTFTSVGDGVSFPSRSQEQVNNYNSMDNSPPVATTEASKEGPVPEGPIPSFGDGVTYPVRTVDEDYDQLLGDRQRWMEEGDGEQDGFDNVALSTKM